MKKLVFLILAIAVFAAAFYYIWASSKGLCRFWPVPFSAGARTAELDKALDLLKFRNDASALAILERVLAAQPDNPDALWGRAEILRRSHRHKEAEGIFKEILSRNPLHAATLVSLAHIRYKENKLKEAQALVEKVFYKCEPVKESLAMAYIMLGAINSKRASSAWLLDKIRYVTQIKRYFLKGKELVPDLPEAALGLGSFYLLAPGIVGGNLDKAIAELEYAVKIAPDFATANARLGQAYARKGNKQKSELYISRAKKLDPDNEVLKELEVK